LTHRRINVNVIDMHGTSLNILIAWTSSVRQRSTKWLSCLSLTRSCFVQPI